MLESFDGALRRRLSERWYCPSPVGLEVDEITTSTSFWPYELPAVYRRFLMVCGREAGDMFFEYQWQLHDLPRSMNVFTNTHAKQVWLYPMRLLRSWITSEIIFGASARNKPTRRS